MSDKKNKKKLEEKTGINTPPVLPNEFPLEPEDLPTEIAPSNSEVPLAEIPVDENDYQVDYDPPTEINSDRDDMPHDDSGEGSVAEPM